MIPRRKARSSWRVRLTSYSSRKAVEVADIPETSWAQYQVGSKMNLFMRKCNSNLIWVRETSYEMELVFPVWLSYWSCQFCKSDFVFAPFSGKIRKAKFISFKFSAFFPAFPLLHTSYYNTWVRPRRSPPEKNLLFMHFSLARHCCCSTEPISSLSGKRIYCSIKR